MLNGRGLLVESQAERWGAGGGESTFSARNDWMSQRLGANPPDSLVNLLVEHRRSVLAACGVPVEVLGGGDGSARREAWRGFVYGTLAPLGTIVEREVRRALGIDIRLRWDSLRASDITGRARAFKSLVEAGMDAGRAEALVGFDGAA